MMKNVSLMIDSIALDLYDFLGAVSVGLTEKDFLKMESRGMKVDREMIEKARVIHEENKAVQQDKAA